MNDVKKDEMIQFWSDRARLYGSDPRANTNDIWLREIEISYVKKVIDDGGHRRILDFGCANGYSTVRLAKSTPGATFTGIDINAKMIAIGRSIDDAPTNVEFKHLDVWTGLISYLPSALFRT
jgi:2-polyprenyl-3-methyl-5-hydroxy-6-metoxy-1,4-benzoquinol methylase